MILGCIFLSNVTNNGATTCGATGTENKDKINCFFYIRVNHVSGLRRRTCSPICALHPLFSHCSLFALRFITGDKYHNSCLCVAWKVGCPTQAKRREVNSVLYLLVLLLELHQYITSLHRFNLDAHQTRPEACLNPVTPRVSSGPNRIHNTAFQMNWILTLEYNKWLILDFLIWIKLII